MPRHAHPNDPHGPIGGWHETSWTRFKKRLKKPANKTDYLLALIVVWLLYLAAILWMIW